MASCFGSSPRPDNAESTDTQINEINEHAVDFRRWIAYPFQRDVDLGCRDPWEFQPQQQDGPAAWTFLWRGEAAPANTGSGRRVEVDYCGLRFAPGSCVRRSPWLEGARN